MGNRSVSGAVFAIDTTDIRELAQTWRSPAVDRLILDELTTAGQKSGQHVKRHATALIKNKTGKLAQTTEITSQVSATLINTEIEWTAKSARGFPYPVAVNYGRGPVEAKAGKVLRFEIDGQVFYRKRVGPAKAQHFAERGLQAAETQIVAEHRLAADRIAARVERLS